MDRESREISDEQVYDLVGRILREGSESLSIAFRGLSENERNQLLKSAERYESSLKDLRSYQTN